MKKIVAQPRIAHAGLFGNGFESGVRIHHAHGHQVSGIRDPVHPDAAVIVRHVFDEPIDRVVGVRALGDALRVSWVWRSV